MSDGATVFVVMLLVAWLVLLSVELYRSWSSIRGLKDRIDDLQKKHMLFKEKVYGTLRTKGKKGLRDLSHKEAYGRRSTM